MRWKVPRMWEGGECWIIGGGPSMLEQFEIPSDLVRQVKSKTASPAVYSPYLSAIHDKHVIGVNMAFHIGTWMDMVFFGDRSFFTKYKSDLAKFSGLRVSCASSVKDYHWVKYLQKHKRNDGLSHNPEQIMFNTNSGAAAINIAMLTGAKRIVLLGFDMVDVGQGQWWHGMYKDRTRGQGESVFRRHLRGYPAIARDLKQLGVECLNASPQSAISVFKKVNVRDLL